MLAVFFLKDVMANLCYHGSGRARALWLGQPFRQMRLMQTSAEAGVYPAWPLVLPGFSWESFPPTFNGLHSSEDKQGQGAFPCSAVSIPLIFSNELENVQLLDERQRIAKSPASPYTASWAR